MDWKINHTERIIAVIIVFAVMVFGAWTLTAPLDAASTPEDATNEPPTTATTERADGAVSAREGTDTSTATSASERADSGPGLACVGGERVIRSLKVRMNKYDMLKIGQDLNAHRGRLVMHVVNEGAGGLFTINGVTNSSGRIVWSDHRVEIYQIVQTERRLLVTGDVQSDRVAWSCGGQLANVSDRRADRESSNIQVNITDDVEYGDYRVTANHSEDGAVHVEHWVGQPNRRYLFGSGEVPDSVYTLESSTIRVIYVHGDERRVIKEFVPPDTDT